MRRTIRLALLLSALLICSTVLAESTATEEYCPDGIDHVHNWGEWETIEPVDCQQDGSRLRRCLNCGFEQFRVVTKLPHTFSRWEITTEATDHGQGTRWRICELCGLQQTESYDPEGTLRLGSYGDKVKELQQLLVDQGYLSADKVDGDYGETTEYAVSQFQRDAGVTPDGVAWPQTQELLAHDYEDWIVHSLPSSISSGLRTRRCRKCGFVFEEILEPEGVLRIGSRGTRVLTLQRALRRHHYATASADGRYGMQTEASIKAYEKSVGLTGDGVAWPGVYQLLVPNIAEDAPETDLILTMTMTSPDVGIYEDGETLDFIWTAFNQGGAPIHFTGLYRIDAGTALNHGAVGVGECIDGDTDRPALKANIRSITYGRFSIPADTAQAGPDGLMTLYFDATAVSDDGSQTFLSNVVSISIPVGKRPDPTPTPEPTPRPTIASAPTEQPTDDGAPCMTLTPENYPADVPVDSAEVRIDVTLRSMLTEGELTLTGFDFVDGDTIELAPDAVEPIAPGGAAKLTYVVRPTDIDRLNGCGARYVRIEAFDETAGKFVSVVAQVAFAFAREEPSLTLAVGDLPELSGAKGDVIELPLTAFNNGSEPLTITKLVIGASDGSQNAGSDEATISEGVSLAPGEALPFVYRIHITDDDMAFASLNIGAFNRTLWLYAKADATGEELIATGMMTLHYTAQGD